MEESPCKTLAAIPAAAPAPGDGLSLLAPYAFTLPQDVSVLPPSATSVTFVHGNGSTRVVARALTRVPDEEADHAAELARLMELFAPGAQDFTPLTLTPGFHGLMAVTPYALEGAGTERVDQVTVMVLWQTALRGELLILSGYDMAGDEEKAQALLDMVLAKVKVQGEPVFITEE